MEEGRRQSEKEKEDGVENRVDGRGNKKEIRGEIAQREREER